MDFYYFISINHIDNKVKIRTYQKYGISNAKNILRKVPRSKPTNKK